MALRDTIPLQKSKIIKKSIGRIIGTLVITTFVILISLVYSFSLTALEPAKDWHTVKRVAQTVFFLIVFINILWTLLYQWLYWKRYFYDADDKNIIIRKGVITQKESTLPFSRITDVYVDQDLLDVIFGLYDVHISTPTRESGLFAHIDGINKEGSQQLRQIILDNINKDES